MWKTRTAMSGAGDSPALTSATLGRNLPSGKVTVAHSPEVNKQPSPTLENFGAALPPGGASWRPS